MSSCLGRLPEGKTVSEPCIDPLLDDLATLVCPLSHEPNKVFSSGDDGGGTALRATVKKRHERDGKDRKTAVQPNK